ncbi:cupin domain-containing protein [Halorubellus sp. JP-L1]|uniref:cupin domain-containing protein n=1 Tax=Halorubellus sp. JP-L1 TaxID=2715753 RepID=UPI00140A39AF|nr:cupin domain-containing protein [Halorubellus sp. JP-L1]NHN42231.1 cupin domain-containing protein [Halorubellus sp. JP-L1]
MEKVSIDDIDAAAPPDENVPEDAMATSIGGVRQLGERLGATNFALNHFVLAPGESPAHSMHRHPEQEEVFYVLSGTVTVETPAEDAVADPAEDDALVVETDEVVRVPPDTYQFVVNRSDDPAALLALGAPSEYQGEGDYLISCPTCGERTEQSFGLETDEAGDPTALVAECRECDDESHRIAA